MFDLELENKLEKIDEIIDQLEKKKLSIAQSVQKYKEGMALIKECEEEFKNLEREIKNLDTGEEF